MKLRDTFLCLSLAIISLLVISAHAAKPPQNPIATHLRTNTGATDPSKEEITRIAAMLTAQPVCFGRTVNDRATWNAMAQTAEGKKAIGAGVRVLKTPMPEQSDETFLLYTKRGSRTESDALNDQRRSRIPALVLAELLENKGRFLPELEKDIRSLCAERTWVGAAHDAKLDNFNKKEISIDLYSSALAWTLATTDCLLGEKLTPETRKLIRDETRWRIFTPYHRMLEGKQSRHWLEARHNWNAVCLAGVTGAALGLIDSREERALFVASAMKYSQNFLAGFTADGYCGEGTGYWSYGYGHYVLLSEIIRLATQDKIDLLARPEALAPAAFPLRFELTSGIYPAFADTSIDSKPSMNVMRFVNERFGFGQPLGSFVQFPSGKGPIFETMMFAFPVPVRNKPAGARLADADGPRSWFNDARILICRPGQSSGCKLAAAIIGNNNGVNHNHNDVGSFIAAVGKQVLIADPGSEKYTARTFSSKRYESNVINSFGHSCPLVAGKLQDSGPQAQAVTLKTDFSNERDLLKFDIRSAYPVKDLTKLERSYLYSRQGLGSLTVTDVVAFKKPESYETALITFGTWQKTGPNTLKIEDGGEALEVKIDTGGKPFEIVPVEIHEEIHAKRLPTRLGIRITEPITKASIRVKMTPSK